MLGLRDLQGLVAVTGFQYSVALAAQEQSETHSIEFNVIDDQESCHDEGPRRAGSNVPGSDLSEPNRMSRPSGLSRILSGLDRDTS